MDIVTSCVKSEAAMKRLSSTFKTTQRKWSCIQRFQGLVPIFHIFQQLGNAGQVHRHLWCHAAPPDLQSLPLLFSKALHTKNSCNALMPRPNGYRSIQTLQHCLQPKGLRNYEYPFVRKNKKTHANESPLACDPKDFYRIFSGKIKILRLHLRNQGLESIFEGSKTNARNTFFPISKKCPSSQKFHWMHPSMLSTLGSSLQYHNIWRDKLRFRGHLR